MSFVIAAPEALATAAADAAGIASTLGTARAAAAGPTTGVLAAAGDEVSTQIAALFSAHGLGFQQLTARASAFHEQFVQTLTAGANAYASAEANVAQTLASALDAPAAGGIGGVLSSAATRAENGFLGNGGLLGGLLNGGSGLLARGAQEIGAAGQAGALLLQPTGGIRALTAAAAALSPAAMTAAAAVTPAANAFAPIAQAIENAYLLIEPYVQYGFELLTWAAGYVVPFAVQINFFYNLIEPIVQSGLFNILDWLSGEITFAQGLSNFWATTTASVNYFINTEINWILSFLPPLPPLPPFFP